MVASVLVVLDGRKVGAEARISLHDAAPSDLEQRNKRRPEIPAERVSRLRGEAVQCHNLHDALSCHRIGLFIDPLDIPERLLLVLVIRAHHNGHNIELEPKTRAQAGAHVLERRGKTGTNELGEVLMLVLLNLGDDIVGNEVFAHAHSIVENNALDREVNEVDGVVDGQGDDSGVVIGEDGRDTQIERLHTVKLAVHLESRRVAVDWGFPRRLKLRPGRRTREGRNLGEGESGVNARKERHSLKRPLPRKQKRDGRSRMRQSPSTSFLTAENKINIP